MESGKAKQRAAETGRRAESGAQHVTANPVLEGLARAGWVVKGLLYLTMGVLAAGLVTGHSHATDQKGSLELLTRLAGSVWGGVLLIAIAVALAGYALWNLLNAVVDPMGSRAGGSTWGRRLAFAGNAVAYGALLVFCVQLVAGRGGGSSDSTVPTLVGSALDHPFGVVLVALAGAVAIVVGVGQLVQAVRSSFSRDLEKQEMNEAERKTAVALGRFGSAARGVVFIVLGSFVAQAAIFHDPHRAKGLGGAFGTLAGQPFGRVLLGVVALGFVALALYSLAAARWLRMPGSAGAGDAGGSGGQRPRAAATR